MIYETHRNASSTRTPYPDVLRLIYAAEKTTPAAVAARLGTDIREATARIAILVRLGYVRDTGVGCGDCFTTTQTGSRAAEALVRRDDEFWIQAPRVAHMGPDELRELRSRPKSTGMPCPVPSCSGTRVYAPQVDLEWGCPTCGLIQPCDTVTLMARMSSE
ncbi:MAG: hypothetical protein OXU74_10935 [Gemmatimonadota bacterium]|nr:hypothetical protein [Gemmatimonadota bacterium]